MFKKIQIPEYLIEHWQLADQHQEDNNHSIFKKWYYDDPTQSQLIRLKNEGFKTNKLNLNKGKASDLIGLTEYPDDEDIEQLIFFNQRTATNKTQAVIQLRRVFKNQDNQKKWLNRPPSQTQQALLTYLNINSSDLGHHQAQKKIEEQQLTLELEKQHEFDTFENIIRELTSPDLQELFNTKKPTNKLIFQALEELEDDNITLNQIDTNPDLIIDKLLEIRPGLKITEPSPYNEAPPTAPIQQAIQPQDNSELLEATRLASAPSRGTAILLALFLGGLGAHKFYTGKTGWGILYLVFCWTFIPLILSILELLGWLFTSDKEFRKVYAPKL